MGYRWFNVRVENDKNEDTVKVRFEGRGEFPFGETYEVEDGESLRINGNIEQGDLSEQPDVVEWSVHHDGETIDSNQGEE